MFLKTIKDFSLKKIIKKRLPNYKLTVTEGAIQTVGLLIDESYFVAQNDLIQELVANGIPGKNIEILIYKDRIKKKETFEYPYFSRKNIAMNGEFLKPEVAGFVNKPFDMLISYYDVEKAPLLLLTLQSKAKFKVGFSTIDKRLNNFMITTVAEKYQEFVSELFKYLKILNKI
ncbi:MULTISPECIES: hypothetical protein [unclassified Flavobacterium]|uniref:DUF6913 domain-containing protein n=1 Tax=unclassified Flavobacterium TaxID=196869 RepID=UPI00086B1277|nr:MULTISPECIES: hypothetical protein [unclassified Flavobacterium]MBN9282977.1 hypothetical protein [Flavobacterium sp.]ODS83488.1 MAG: hypothetical protein ABS44_17395 [Chryseobacterium sp. SCN 40-13]OJV67611.1 MAG: hypothetical protein BGO42_16395 [Flavobacterium sp. 40-81]